MLFKFLILPILVPLVLGDGSYFVSLKPTESLESFLNYDINYPTSQQVKALIKQSFSIGSFSGFSGKFSNKVLERLRRCPLVSEITEDIIVKAFETTTQEHAPSHLVRLSQRSRLSSDDTEYLYDSEASGAGVTAYVIDSGVATNHPEFEGRAKPGIDLTGEGFGDWNGHGTHVAGVIGSSTYGVSKNVEIMEIKALASRGEGSLSTVIAALEYVVQHRIRKRKPGVANLSLGSARNLVLNRAVSAAVKTGLVVVVAAGNSNTDACYTSPASVLEAITVGAIDDFSDAIASFSNWGKCVDIFASGVQVESLNPRDLKYPHTLSGTSMASPVVTGLIANLLSDGIKPKDIKEEIIRLSTNGAISRASLFFKWQTPNRIAYNGVEKVDDNNDDDD